MITYTHEGALYVNMTNLCTNKCDFCLRSKKNGMFDELWYKNTEPTREQIWADIASQNVNAFREIVFCGYGEPTCRLYDMLTICRAIREKWETPIRLNTNGHASLIMEEDTTPLFSGLFDVISISLNAPDSDTYMRLCNPKFGENTFEGVLKFARDVSKVVPRVVLTAVSETLSAADMSRCRDVANGLGLEFREREFV